MTKTAHDILKAADPRAATLYELLTGKMGVPDSELDRGVPFIECGESSCNKSIEAGTAGNGRIEPAEVYEAAVALLEAEENSFAMSEGLNERPFTDLVSKKTDFRVPWLFNDFNPKTKSDDKLLLSLFRMASDARVEAALEAGGWEAPGFEKALTKKLVSRMLSDDGLALRPGQPMPPEDAAVDLLTKPKALRSGACTELSRIAYGLFRLAGLSPFFIEVQKDSKSPETNNHMAVGVKAGAGGKAGALTVDMLHDGWISEEGHLLQSEMPAITSLAAYFTNKAHFEMTKKKHDRKKQDEEIGTLLGDAIAFDPSFSLARYNNSVFIETRLGDKAGAHREASKAVKLRPFDKSYRQREREISRKLPKKPTEAAE